MRVTSVELNQAALLAAFERAARTAIDDLTDDAVTVAKSVLYSGDPAGRGLSAIGYQGGFAAETAAALYGEDGTRAPLPSEPQLPHQNTGTLEEGIASSPAGVMSPGVVEGRVVSRAPYSKAMNEGLPPGQAVDLAALQRWIDKHEVSVSAAELAERIERRGMAGSGFWNAAYNDVSLGIAPKAGKRIREEFS